MQRDYYQEIASLALAEAPSGRDTVLLYALAFEGGISASLFAENAGRDMNTSPVAFKFCSDKLRDLVSEFLTDFAKFKNDDDFIIMDFLIRDGRFEASFLRPDEVTLNQFDPELRKRAVRKHFPGLEVDYSNPK